MDILSQLSRNMCSICGNHVDDPSLLTAHELYCGRVALGKARDELTALKALVREMGEGLIKCANPDANQPGIWSNYKETFYKNIVMFNIDTANKLLNRPLVRAIMEEKP